jgi:small ligand-binding sensory domain FIST
MMWKSAAAHQPEIHEAINQVVLDAYRDFDERSVDLVLLFLSSHHIAHALVALDLLTEQFPGATILGCSANSVIGAGEEIEDGPGVSLTLAHLPGVTLSPFHISRETLVRAGRNAAAWRSIVAAGPDEPSAFLLLGDPFTGDSEELIGGIELACPGAIQIGGLASGSREPGGNLLLLDDKVLSEGYVGIGLGGDFQIDTVIAQGCRPIGEPMFITRCDQNIILEVDGRPPFEVVNELFAKANERERSLFQTSLFVGVQMNPQRAEIGRGDFLIRNVVGGDSESGAMAIGSLVEQNQVVQFQLRDGETAAEDLNLRLTDYMKEAQESGLDIFSHASAAANISTAHRTMTATHCGAIWATFRSPDSFATERSALSKAGRSCTATQPKYQGINRKLGNLPCPIPFSYLSSYCQIFYNLKIDIIL